MATQIAEQTAQAAREQLVREKEAKASEINKGRTGKGTRIRVGQTRGKNPQVIDWEAFDDSQPSTLPTTLSEFMDLTKVQDEKAVVAFLIDGYNSAQYTAASDPIAEYVEATWPEEIQRMFRLVVRNYSNSAGVSLEDAVALIKPGVVASQAKK